MKDPKKLAENGLKELEEAILTYIKANTDGVRNSDLAKDLGLESDMQGKQKNYLTYSILGILINRGLVKKVGQKHSCRFLAA